MTKAEAITELTEKYGFDHVNAVRGIVVATREGSTQASSWHAGTHFLVAIAYLSGGQYSVTANA